MIYSIISLGVIVLNTVAWFLIYRKGQALITRWFLIPLGGAILWTLGWLVIYQVGQLDASSIEVRSVLDELVAYIYSNQAYLVEIFGKVMYSGALAIPFGFMVTALHYPRVTKHPYWNLLISDILLATYVIFLVPMIFFDHVISGAVTVNGFVLPEYGNWFWLYGIVISLGLLGGCMIMIRRMQRVKDEKQRTVMKFFLLGFFLTVIGVMSTNILYPALYGEGIVSVFGPLFTSIWVTFVLIGLFRAGVVDVKVVVSQILLGFMGLIIVIITVNNESLVSLIFDLLVLAIFLVLSYLLIRELQRESERKDALRKANTKLQKLVDVKDNFLRMTSHQLRTPLSGLQGYVSLLLENEEKEFKYPKDMKGDLVKIFLNTQRLSTVVDDLSMANAISSKRFELDMKHDVEVDVLMNKVIEDRTHFIQEKEIDITCECKTDQYHVKADVLHLENAFAKLIDNALMFGKKKVQVALECGTKYITIRIKDDGMGITRDEMQSLYQRFRRSKRAIRVHPDGSGLGLYLAKYVIENHGGDISAKSAGEDKGAEFIVRLPKA